LSGERLYDALKFTVGLRLDELRSQQQRAVTIAAADGVLLGFVATVSVGAAGMSRVLTLVALGLLALGLVAAAVAIWPQNLPVLAENPALEGTDEAVANAMCQRLSATLTLPKLSDIYKTREIATRSEMVLVGIALALLMLAAIVSSPAAPQVSLR